MGRRKQEEELLDLRAYTVRDPWATALAEGWKPVEGRGRPPPPSVLGKVTAIHAGVAPVPEPWVAEVRRLTGRHLATRDFHPGHILAAGMVWGWLERTTLGIYLATQATSPRLITKPEARDLLAGIDDWWHPEFKYGWLFGQVVKLRKPLPARSASPTAVHLGPWRLHEVTAAAILDEWNQVHG